MDLLTAVALSLLPVSRSKAAAVFKQIRLEATDDLLGRVLESCEIRGAAPHELVRTATQHAATLLEAGRAAGIEPIAWNDDRFPALLGCIADPPPVLWVRGNPEIFGQPTVAIVGSRAATPYAREIAGRLAEELVERGIAVASGLARGADSAAHRGCLQANGHTVAVLGSGLDRVYPAEHEPLADEIGRKGLLVSELGPGAPPLPEHFPLRNRIISGISLAVVVVEATEKSGSLITARSALEQGRDVMAVPGSVLSGRNRGSHGLLKDGAKVVESADDILDGLGWPAARAETSSPKSLYSDALLMQMAVGEAYRLDELMELTGQTGQKVLTRLMELELAGLVASAGGGRFTREKG
jgi:DNA processing protein